MSSVYYGVPGHCFDADGCLWHEPGQCKGAPVNCSGKCCGYMEEKDPMVAPKPVVDSELHPFTLERARQWAEGDDLFVAEARAVLLQLIEAKQQQAKEHKRPAVEIQPDQPWPTRGPFRERKTVSELPVGSDKHRALEAAREAARGLWSAYGNVVLGGEVSVHDLADVFRAELASHLETKRILAAASDCEVCGRRPQDPIHDVKRQRNAHPYKGKPIKR